jgi:hypothetical protein
MRRKARQDVMRVLPNRFGDNQRGSRVESLKDLESLALAGDETVLLRFLVGMGAHEQVAHIRENLGQLCFHGLLRGPACLVSREPKIAAGDKINLLGVEPGLMFSSHREILEPYCFPAKTSPRTEFSLVPAALMSLSFSAHQLNYFSPMRRPLLRFKGAGATSIAWSGPKNARPRTLARSNRGKCGAARPGELSECLSLGL